MTFFQDPPQLGNQLDDDDLLASYLERVLSADVLRSTRDELRHLGELGGGELYRLMMSDLENLPKLRSFDPWGRRVDEVEITAVWRRAKELTAEHGLVATGYDRALGPDARVLQFAKNYLVQASLDIYSCPLAMTDGAVRTLIELDNRALLDRALPRLTSRDPRRAWTSGQWMTERTGGSDVSTTETVARRLDGSWRLHGSKWFTSAITAEMALTLARPEGNPAGSKGLALFYLELRDEQGRMNGITVSRLKDKLGTRKLPTAELELDGTRAVPVAGFSDGVKNITTMLRMTRMWNAVAAAWMTRRAVALMRDYAGRRRAFQATLAEHPLHLDTVAGVAAEADAVFHLAFRMVELVGRLEHGVATDSEKALIRLMTPIAKLTTGKQAMAVVSEMVESFAGAGYCYDTGLPQLLCDAQVLPIWEGTTNVLALDSLRALAKDGTWAAFEHEVRAHCEAARDPALGPCIEAIRRSMEDAGSWLRGVGGDRAAAEAGARRFALTLGRTLQAALLARHADWCAKNGKGRRATLAALRFASHGLHQIDRRITTEESALLAMGG